MKKEECISEVGRPILRPLGILQFVFILAVISSPFVWIWHSWSLAWKIGLTGIIAMIITYTIYEATKRIIGEEFDEAIKETENNNPKSKFQQRLEKLAKEKGITMPNN